MQTDRKRIRWEGVLEGRVDEVTNNSFLHDSGEDWRDGDGAEVRKLLGRKSFWYRYDANSLPLLRYGRSGN